MRNLNWLVCTIFDLKVSQNNKLVHLPELLYTELELDTRKSGEKMFDYVDPRNRFKQIEMEKACTAHLKVAGAWLAPKFKEIEFNSAGKFRNRSICYYTRFGIARKQSMMPLNQF